MPDAIKDQYTPTIGIECHVQLKTKTKLFSGADNDAREAPANTLVCHIDFGLPGALPVLNEEAVHLAARAAFALDTVPQKYSIFERKHYFYPDLPMGYQISQLAQPIVVGGKIAIAVDGAQKEIRINRVQMEADAGKSTHPEGRDYSLVDLNRAGTPLLEIVSEADMHTAAEARAYVRELYLRMRYADVTEGNLYYGNMRFDVNVSVSKTDTFGTRTETKNLNSFRAVEKTIEYEINRQIEALERGEAIVQETRGWNDAKQQTFSQRTKENAEDYRYMPDPDLPPIVLDDAFIEQVKAEMPVMPAEWAKRLAELGLDLSQTDTLLEAELDDEAVNYLELIEQSMDDKTFAKQLANWFVNIEIPMRRSDDARNTEDNPKKLAFYKAVFELSKDGKLSSTNAKSLINDILAANEYPEDVASHAERQGFIQVSDEGEIAKIVAEVLSENAKAAEDVKNGEEKAIGFLVGQVMKASRGKANPQLAQELIKKQLSL
jgi:aspartyl-tRNA(Asn)/glutamyl-tRNA(Gln) amidotransferase subunit B